MLASGLGKLIDHVRDDNERVTVDATAGTQGMSRVVGDHRFMMVRDALSVIYTQVGDVFACP